MTLRRAYVADAAVTMIAITPTRKVGNPYTRMREGRKALGGELREGFDRTE